MLPNLSRKLPRVKQSGQLLIYRSYLESRVLVQGDVLLLAFGGHGFEMLEPTEMIEVKQGATSPLFVRMRSENPTTYHTAPKQRSCDWGSR